MSIQYELSLKKLTSQASYTATPRIRPRATAGPADFAVAISSATAMNEAAVAGVLFAPALQMETQPLAGNWVALDGIGFRPDPALRVTNYLQNGDKKLLFALPGSIADSTEYTLQVRNRRENSITPRAPHPPFEPSCMEKAPPPACSGRMGQPPGGRSRISHAEPTPFSRRDRAPLVQMASFLPAGEAGFSTRMDPLSEPALI